MQLDVWIEHEGYNGPVWEGGDWAFDTTKRELAKSRSPFFPNGHDAFYLVTEYINSGKYEKNYIDQLTKYVMLPKFKILDMIDKLHCNLDHINERLDELKKYVENLPEQDFYKVVQQEF